METKAPGNLAFFLFLLVLPVFPLWARDVEIYAEDPDLLLPLEGAVVYNWDGEEYLCDENGIARIPVPDDREVVISLSYPGYERIDFKVPLTGDFFTLGPRLAGVLETEELVIEALRPASSEAKTGRSVAISGEALARTSEIGLIEDVMRSVKLLPGVGYTGMFSAMPSIRGGHPGDLTAAMDGFYIETPYHWGGAYSIFDPKMVESARLSHGVFSVRYGHTISGLLEVNSRKPSPTDFEMELGISTSSANLNLSIPLWGKGGILVMGKATYWDLYIMAAKGLSTLVDNENLSQINAVKTAPYIRAGALSADYRFTSDLEMNASFYVGGDGVGLEYKNESQEERLRSRTDMFFSWDNLLGFFTGGLSYNPSPKTLLRVSAGTGFTRSLMDGKIENDIEVTYSDAWKPPVPGSGDSYHLSGPDAASSFVFDNRTLNFQGRADFDWEPGEGFLFSLGLQELYTRWDREQEGRAPVERRIPENSLEGTLIPNGYIHHPMRFSSELSNQAYTTSAYALGEYQSPGGFFGAELGLRGDHVYYQGRDFSIQTWPAANPRLNLDFNLLKDKGLIESLTLTAGTGLFSSMNDAISSITVNSALEDFALKPNRSWTSLLGAEIHFPGGFMFTVEGYFKYVFDRAYQYNEIGSDGRMEQILMFDGEGRVLGFDILLQKFESPHWDGWLTYSFNFARYRDPSRPVREVTETGLDIREAYWYYPTFHRFHYLNLLFNFRPVKRLNIGLRLGLASGRPLNEVGEVLSYPVQLFDESMKPVVDEEGNPVIIERWKRSSRYSDTNRTSWSIPLDIKLSWYFFDSQGRVKTELYLGAENLLSLIYNARGNTTFNTYTGKEDQGSNSAVYELPIPMISVGFKWRY
jgi:hypothetical protein